MPDESTMSLSPEEKRYYGQLYKIADSERLGVITGEVAVKFFEKSGLPAATLGQIWEISDKENSGFLTQQSFSVALRLIGQAQNGKTPEPSLAKSAGPFPRFDGIDVPSTTTKSASVPQPPKSRNTIPPLSLEERNKYYNTWLSVNPSSDLLDGERARTVFSKSKLPVEQLGQIWGLTDTRERGALDSTEFIVAMHLVQSMMNGTIKNLPTQLPPGLLEAAARSGPPDSARSQRQQSSVSSLPGQEPLQQQVSGPRQTVPMRSQLTGPPGRSSPALQQPGPAVPQSQQPAKSNPQAFASGQADWDVKPHEKANYDNLFDGIDKNGKGYITGEEAVEFFLQSKLPEEELALVWDLADMDNSGILNRDFFAVAMHLIKSKLGGRALPPTLPLSLIPPSARPKTQAPSAALFAEAQSQNQAPPQPSSAAADLFGLNDSFMTPAPSQSPPIPAFTDNHRSLDRVASPASPDAASPRSPAGPLRGLSNPTSAPRAFGSQPAFVPASSFGQSIQQQAPTTQFQARKQLEQDLLSDADPTETRNIGSDATEVANLSNQVGSLTAQHQQKQQERSVIGADVAAMQDSRTELTQRLTQIREAYDAEVKTVRAMQIEQTSLRSETRELAKEASLLEASLDAVRQQHEQINSQLEQDRRENLAIKERIRSANEQTATLKATLEKVQKDAKQQRGLVAINTKQLNTLQAEHETLNTTIDQHHAEYDTLTKQIAEHEAQHEAATRGLQEKQRQAGQAAEQNRLRAIEFERRRANDEQKRSALVSPALSSASVSTNPFHRVASPMNESGQQRSIMSPFSHAAEVGQQEATAKSAITSPVLAGVGVAGVGAGAIAIASTVHGDEHQAIDRDFGNHVTSSPTFDSGNPSSANDTAQTNATSTTAPRASTLSGFDHAFSSVDESEQTPQLFETRPHEVEPAAQDPTDLNQDEGLEGVAPVQRQAESLPGSSSEQDHSRNVISPRPINAQAQDWSGTDPFTADPRVNSPQLQQNVARPLPAAVSSLAIPSGGSDDGYSIATSVQAEAPASMRETPIPSRPMTPVSTSWASDTNVKKEASMPIESATHEHELETPTTAEDVQHVLTRAPQDVVSGGALPGSAHVRSDSPIVPGAFPTESSDMQEPQAEQPSTMIGTTQPQVTEIASYPADFEDNHAGTDSTFGDVPSMGEDVAELDSSDDETVEQPRGADMFSRLDTQATQNRPHTDDAASTHTVTEESNAKAAQPTPIPAHGGELTTNTKSQTSGLPTQPSQPANDDFDEFDDLEEAAEADEEENFDTSYTTHEFDPSFDAPSARSSFVPSTTAYPATLSTEPQLASRSFGGPAQASPVRDFSEFAHYGSVIADPSGLAPPIRDTVVSGASAPRSDSVPSNGTLQSQSAPAPPTSRHGATLAPKRPEPARAISAADDPMLIELMDMGFERSKSVGALERFNYDLGAAMDWLLKGN